VKAPQNLPNLLVDEGSRRLALLHLDDATTARARLLSGADAEALHDYRVALRRLRSCIRSYGKWLRGSITERTRRRLRRLARQTNRPRDLEVHLGWLEERRAGAGETERPGIAWMIERLSAAKEEANEDMLDLDAGLFPVVHARLTSRLTRFRTTIDLESDSARRSTAAATAREVRRASRRLRARLDRIHGYSDMDAIHRARIAGKHLRYLLEPFSAAVPQVVHVVERLQALQDWFGDVHDAQVFAAELRDALPEARAAETAGAGLVHGIEVLSMALDIRGKQAFEAASAAWLEGRGGPFFDDVAAVAEAIAALAHRDQEVERKFLLTGLPSLDGAEGPFEIEQGYLPGERLEERVRRVRSEGAVELLRTVKEGSGLTRLEVEERLTPEVFDELWPLTAGRRVHKRRYRIADGELTWEIDEFLDRELVLAEVELVGRPVDVELPDWLRPHVSREVTEDESFSNVHLASNGPSRGP